MKTCCQPLRRRRIDADCRRAFTLIELLVVIAILAIIMTLGIPFIRTAIDNGRGMTKAVKDIQEACSHARAIAILQQKETELRIRPGEGVFEVGASTGAPAGDASFSPDLSGNDWRMGKRPSTAGGGGSSFRAKLPEGIRIEGLGLANDEDWTEAELARVRFYPNGTSDEMSVVLLSDENERRNIWLEIVTGLPEVESDPKQFRAR